MKQEQENNESTLGAVPPNQRDILKRQGTYVPKARASDLARSNGQDLMRGEHVVGKRTTWVAGDRPLEDLDDASRKILAAGGPGQEQTGTSIFDPVLCELVYRWFCPPNGKVLDPFAGGSVRGVVASHLGLEYTGVELSARQVVANEEQGKAICKEPSPKWINGDSTQLPTIIEGIRLFDLVFSCPPYFDLEVYSDDPKDLSTMSWPNFLDAYRGIIKDAVALLKVNRFACFVVGDVRDPEGYYRNLPGETIRAFIDAGTKLYNNAVLVTAVGSLPIRVGKQFEAGRKLGNTHQNVLIFCKGDCDKAADRVNGINL